MKKLSTILASAVVGLGTAGCTHSSSHDLVEYTSAVDSEQALIKRLKAQSGQAGEFYARVYILPDKNAPQPKPDNKYYNKELITYSLDNQTVVLQKPEGGYYENDLFVRIMHKETCKKEKEPSIQVPIDLTLKSLLGDEGKKDENKSEEKQFSGTPEKKCTIEDIVLVHHYSAEETTEIKVFEADKGGSKYIIDPETGKPKLVRGDESFGRLWVPRDAFGVYLVDENNKIVSENLLVEQDIKVLDDGSVVLKTEELGDKPNGNYKVRVVTKYKKERKTRIVDDLRKVKDWKDVKLILRVGMALGSLEHIYSGPDPMDNDGDARAPHVNLLMSNYHVWSESLSGGSVGVIESGGKITMFYMTLGAIPLAKLDDKYDGEWIPVIPYNGLFSDYLDVAIAKLALPIKDKNFPTIVWNEEEPKVGEKVIVVGHPLGIPDTIVNTRAVVSKVGHYAGPDFPNAILFFGDIQGGNSGGGLYNNDGEFVGIPSASYVHIYKDTLETAIEIPPEAVKEVLGKDYYKPISVERLKKSPDMLLEKLLEIPEVKSVVKKIKDPAEATKLAKELYLKVSEEYKSGNMTHVETRRRVVVDTGINLARSAVEIQKWLNSLGVNLGQKVKKDWSD